jgi:glutamate carboxypeptidase
VKTRQSMVDALRSLVEIETPSGNNEALNIGFLKLRSLIEESTGRSAQIDTADGVPFLYVPAIASPSVLFIGHLDTVWPQGTLAEFPFTVSGDVATGPGVFDMKTGLVIAVGALARCEVSDHVALLVTGDEETGSAASRKIIETSAKDSLAVIVTEGATPSGGIKMTRKGVALYKFILNGKAAHAGLEPERGANVTVELGSLITDVFDLHNDSIGTTVSPTVANSGVAVNTIPDHAILHVDARAWTLPELQRVDAAIRSRQTTVNGVKVSIHGGINRPPLEAQVSSELVSLAQQAAHDIGLDSIDAIGVGGGSDGNFTAAMGIPTLDGVGAFGGGAHTRDEWVDLNSLTKRSEWLALVCERVVSGGLNR